jgi:hypothetical protein
MTVLHTIALLVPKYGTKKPRPGSLSGRRFCVGWRSGTRPRQRCAHVLHRSGCRWP